MAKAEQSAIDDCSLKDSPPIVNEEIVMSLDKATEQVMPLSILLSPVIFIDYSIWFVYPK